MSNVKLFINTYGMQIVLEGLVNMLEEIAVEPNCPKYITDLRDCIKGGLNKYIHRYDDAEEEV